MAEYRESHDETDARRRENLLNELVLIRQKSGLRQIDVAKAMGIGQPSVSEFERGQTSPRLDTLQKYARAIGVELVVEVKGSGDDVQPK